MTKSEVFEVRGPRLALVVHPTNRRRVVLILEGLSGYTDAATAESEAIAQLIADRFNAAIGVDRATAAAFLAGSMFGWNVPAADPAHYDSRGERRA